MQSFFSHGEWGLLSGGAKASGCGGFLLGGIGSKAHGLSSCGAQVH